MCEPFAPSAAFRVHYGPNLFIPVLNLAEAYVKFFN